MSTADLAKLLDTPSGQHIELPAGFQSRSRSFYVRQSGDAILLIPSDNPWASLFGSLDAFSDDYMSERCQPLSQVRDVI
jgi:antitoxin VapB